MDYRDRIISMFVLKIFEDFEWMQAICEKCVHEDTTNCEDCRVEFKMWGKPDNYEKKVTPEPSITPKPEEEK